MSALDATRVCVAEGKLKGVVVNGYNNVRYLAFRGIPYAKPPVGELRFKDPVPVGPWSGERDASKYGNIAVQADMYTHEIIGDEDCLYLNVYVPKKIECVKKCTVMVWIHGGGYFSGSGDPYWYGPDYIMQKDVVLVTLNYRLHVFGFLNLNDEVITGNQGLKDVILALKWVQRNIRSFGGDPDNVTIFGESAGASMVHCLTLSPLAKGLFDKAISQSGVILNPWAYNDKLDSGFRLAKKLGKETSDPKVAYEFLKTINAETLTKNSLWEISTESEKLSFTLTFTPTLDNKSSNPVFPVNPKEYINRGVEIPYLLGSVRNEGILLIRNNFFVDMSDEDIEKVNANFTRGILLNVLNTLPEIGITPEELRFSYFGKNEISEKTLTNYSYFLGDEFFVRGIIDVVEIQKTSGNCKTTFLYKFDYESPTSLMKTILNVGLPGVSHAEDLGFEFAPSVAQSFNLSLPKPGSNDYKVIDDLTQMWTDFAKTGKPTPITNLWSPLTGPQNKNYNYLNIDLNPKMKIYRKGEERWDWERLKKTF